MDPNLAGHQPSESCCPTFATKPWVSDSRSIVPVIMLFAELGAGLPEPQRESDLMHTVLVRVASGWHCMGLVVVLLIAHAGGQLWPTGRSTALRCWRNSSSTQQLRCFARWH